MKTTNTTKIASKKLYRF